MSDSRIIRKLKSLLAMSNDKSSEHESMIAARQLHSLLAKHNMSMDSLDEVEEEVGEDCEEFKAPPWKRNTALAIAKLYFCEVYYVRLASGKAKIFFVGKESNRTFALYVFKMVTSSVEREARKESRKVYGKENCAFVNSFWTGAMSRIIERTRDLIAQAKEGSLQDDEGNTLPAMVNIYEKNSAEVQDWLDANKNLRTSKSKTTIKDAEGYSRGQAAGDRAQLSRAIQGKSATLQIGN